jgi:hypothetical protein
MKVMSTCRILLNLLYIKTKINMKKIFLLFFIFVLNLFEVLTATLLQLLTL